MEDNKKSRVLDLTIKLESLMPLIDLFVQDMNDSDIELLNEVKDQLKEKISHNESGIILIHALGGDYDRTEDEIKLKTTECLLEMVQIRKDGLKKIKEANENIKKRREALAMFGIM